MRAFGGGRRSSSPPLFMREDRLTFSQRVEWIVVAGRELRALVKRASGVNGKREWQPKQPLRPGVEGQQR
jgi:hypothetical protein